MNFIHKTWKLHTGSKVAQFGASFPTTHTNVRQLFPSSSLMNDSRNICSSKRTLAIKRKSISFFYAYGNQNNWARTPSRFPSFLSDCRQGCKSLSLTLHASTPATSEPKHIFLAELQKREEESRKLRKNEILQHFPSLFYLLSLRFDCIFFIPTSEKG